MIRIMIIDDQKVVRSILTAELERYPDLRVMHMASSAEEALQILQKDKPDVILLDLEMPGMNGIEFLHNLKDTPKIPVIVLSALTEAGSKAAFDAMSAGALDCVLKSGPNERDYLRMLNELILRIRGVYMSKIAVRDFNATSGASQSFRFSANLIAIGASTGGTQAIEQILAQLPEETPPILITQHLPAHFTRMYAERVNTISPLQVSEAGMGEELKRGHAYVAPGAWHLMVRERTGRFFTELSGIGRVNNHRPSVDVLFESIADTSIVKSSLGIILTGMGKDGARGLLAMKQNGSHTIGQDEESSVVYGMPREAFECGAVREQLPLNEIAAAICRYSGLTPV